MRYLGIDPGKKRVGLAISDPGGQFASPLEVVAPRSLAELLGSLEAVCSREEIEALVVGLPLRMDGTKGPAALEAERLAEALAERTGLPVEMWDERLSSVSAERSLLSADLSRARRRARIDKVAAQIILQAFLDAQGRRRGGAD